MSDAGKLALALKHIAGVWLEGTDLGVTFIVHTKQLRGAVTSTLPTEQLVRALLADVLSQSLSQHASGADEAVELARADKAALEAARSAP
jgi:hypothetical protein